MTTPDRAVYSIPYADLGVLGTYLLECRDRGMSARTVILKWQRLTAMRDVLGMPLEMADESDARRWWRSIAARRLANSTRGTYLAHARAFYLWAVLENHSHADPTRRIRAPLRRHGVPRDIDPGRVLALLDRIDGPAWYMISLGLWCGLRCGEIAQVMPSRDLVERSPGRWVLHVRGKGGHARQVSVPAQLAAAMLTRARRGWLFPNADSHVLAGQVSRYGAQTLRAGGIPATMHQLRHTHATALYQATRDPYAVQRQLGHASVATSQVYTRAAALDPGVVEHLFGAVGEAGRASPTEPRVGGGHADPGTPRTEAGKPHPGSG